MTISKQHWCPNDRTPFGNSQTRDIIYNQKTNKIISSSAHPNPLPGVPGRGDRTCPQSLPVRYGSGHRRVEGWRCRGSLAEAVIFGFCGWPGDTTSLKRGCRVGGGGHRDVRHCLSQGGQTVARSPGICRGGAVLAVSRGLHRRAVGRERICDRCQPTFEEVG